MFWRKASLLPFVFCLCLFQPAHSTYGQTTTKVDYVLVIDVSGSMVGRPTGTVIFPMVKESILNFIDQLGPGNTLTIATFADGIKAIEHFAVTDSTERTAAKNYVDELDATGNYTWVYQSILDVFDYYNSQVRKEDDRIGILLVYTDGLDNKPSGLSMAQTIKEFGLKRQTHDWIYYSTLGVALGQDEQISLATSGFTTYNPNPEGTVQPIRIIEPRYKLLDFGNLLTNEHSERTILFNVLSASGLPSRLSLTAEADFPAVESQGAYVNVEGSINPEKESTLSLTLANKQELTHGFYSGKIFFTSSDPSIFVIPGAIDVRFRYEPRRTVSVGPPAGTGKLMAALGKQNPFRPGNKNVVASVEFPLNFNSEALKKGGGFEVIVEQNAGNQLPSTSFRINDSVGMSHNVSVSDGNELQFGVEIDSTATPGDYNGTLVLSGVEIEVDNSTQEIPWSLTVVNPPWTVGQWASFVLSLLAILFIVVFVGGGLITGKWPIGKPDVLRGSMVIVAPVSRLNETIDLTGKREVKLGKNCIDLSDALACVSIVPVRKHKKVHTRLIVEEGTVSIRHLGELYDAEVKRVILENGDLINLGPYKLEFVPY